MSTIKFTELDDNDSELIHNIVNFVKKAYRLDNDNRALREIFNFYKNMNEILLDIEMLTPGDKPHKAKELTVGESIVDACIFGGYLNKVVSKTR